MSELTTGKARRTEQGELVSQRLGTVALKTKIAMDGYKRKKGLAEKLGVF